MRIYNYVYPNFSTNYLNTNNNKKYQNSNVYFTGVNKTITSSYGALSKSAQNSLENLHTNLKSIKELFLRFEHNPQKAIAIKNGYSDPDMLQKNRHAGIAFKLPDNQGILTIRQLRVNDKLLRFVVEKDGNMTHFLTDGFNKSVANVNQKNPQMLPRRFRYMMPNEIKESKIEKYISYADEKIQNYRTYLNQFIAESKPQTESVLAEIRERNAEKMRRYRASKKPGTQKPVPQTISAAKYQLEKSDLKDIMELFQKKPEELPAHLKPVLTPSNNIIGFSLQTSDGGILKVCKKINAKYGGNMAYLGFEKLFSNGDKSYMSIDLHSYKFLKMKDAGKPLIRNHTVYEYSPEEIEKRNMVQKFNAYIDEIFKGEKISEVKPEPVKEVETPVQAEKSEPIKKAVTRVLKEKPAAQTQAKEIINEENIPNSNFEKLKQTTIKKAVEDAKTLSDLYFKTFMEEFNKNITQKITDFKADVDKFLQNLWQK